MSLAAGTKLGPYEIVALLGAGGMGEVYRARDARLDRDVAVKVLPVHLSADPEVRARFEREAKSVAALNHSNICALYDVGSHEGTDYLVMELLEGETLADRLVKGSLPLAELLRVGAQIADALDKAHRKGLVHRDLKPGNVMLTKSGAKLMDFGLARVTGLGVTSGLTNSPTIARPFTAEGKIVGTFEYMPPEQLEGKEADARSDIWALGATLYEMATGRRAFEGASQASLISSILRDEPRPIAELVPLSPPAFERVVRQCLAKDPDDRWQNAGDLRRELEWMAGGSSSFATGPVASAPRRAPRGLVAWAVAGVALAVAAAALVLPPARVATPAIRANVPAPPGAVFLFSGDNSGPPVISPDGKRLAFVAVTSEFGARVWIRELDDLVARSLPGTEGAVRPFWSPDGMSVGFFAAAKLKRIDLAGGQVITLYGPIAGAKGGTWSADGTIVFCPDYRSNLLRIAASGGTATKVTEVDKTRHSTHRWPQLLPDGKHFLYFAGNHTEPAGELNEVWFGSLDGTENRALMPAVTDAAYASGHLFFVKDELLFAQPFDPARGRMLGEPIPTREKVHCDSTTWKANFSVSEAGVLTYQASGNREGSQILMLDRAGKTLSLVTPPGNYYNLDLARDEGNVAYALQETPTSDIFLHDLHRDLRRRLTFSSADDDSPVLSPAGDRVAFTSAQLVKQGMSYYVLTVAQTSGAGSPEVLAGAEDHDIWPVAWSSDGRFLICSEGDYQGLVSTSVTVREARSGGRVIPLLGDRDHVTSARFSPDDRWIAFSSVSDSGQDVFVISSPLAKGSVAKSGRWQISGNGGTLPRWRADGRELYYIRSDGAAMSIAVDGSANEFHVGAEKEMFRTVLRGAVEAWDASSDGQRFLVNTLAGANSAQIVVVSDWRPELKKH